jgi:aminomethyltransferase
MNKTPLYSRHVSLGARIIDFGGWAMPVQYTNVIEEHLTTRSAAGLFDICHMGEIDVRGKGAFDFLQHVLSRNLDGQKIGQMKLSILATAAGGIMDDLTVYLLDENHYRLVTNAATKDKDYAWLLKVKDAKGFSQVEIADETDNIGKLDLQGPRSGDILQQVIPVSLQQLKFYHSVQTQVLNIPAIVSRSGYTGEDGFEVYAPHDRIGEIWDRLLQVGSDYGLKPIGLGARDTLRLESGMMLYGNDMDETITPYEVVYGWVVNLEKDFIGRDALDKQLSGGVKRKLVGFTMGGRGIARHGYKVFKDGKEVGIVTSGTHSPTLEKAIGLAFVPVELSKPGTTFDIQIRNNFAAAQVVSLPFYKKGR